MKVSRGVGDYEGLKGGLPCEHAGNTLSCTPDAQRGRVCLPAETCMLSVAMQPSVRPNSA